MKTNLITKAFKVLRKSGLIARQRFMCCGECASSSLMTSLTAAAAAGKPRIGVVYYHAQDDEMFRNARDFHVGYGGYGTTSTKEVGEKIVEVFTALGIKTTWDGDPNNRILVSAKDAARSIS